jgi:hypothetical protein
MKMRFELSGLISNQSGSSNVPAYTPQLSANLSKVELRPARRTGVDVDELTASTGAMIVDGWGPLCDQNICSSEDWLHHVRGTGRSLAELAVTGCDPERIALGLIPHRSAEAASFVGGHGLSPSSRLASNTGQDICHKLICPVDFGHPALGQNVVTDLAKEDVDRPPLRLHRGRRRWEHGVEK